MCSLTKVAIARGSKIKDNDQLLDIMNLSNENKIKTERAYQSSD